MGDHQPQRARKGAVGRNVPAYDYACEACGARVELRHRIDESPSSTCAACGGSRTRLFTVPRLNVGTHSSATSARYAKLMQSEEVGGLRADLAAAARPRRAEREHGRHHDSAAP